MVGAGYREDLFQPGPASRQPASIAYAGKLSAAKGLPSLLDAVERIAQRREVVLHVAGDGSGDEADHLRERMRALAPRVVWHGAIDQPTLAGVLRRASVFVLPSFYEGLPLVLIEALASGCRLVCTDLPAVREMADSLHGVLERVALPRLVGPDCPVDADLPAFASALSEAIERAIDVGPVSEAELAGRLSPFRWDAVFSKVESVWKELCGLTGR